MGRTTEDLINEAMDKANKGVEQAVEHAKSFVPFGAPEPHRPRNQQPPHPSRQRPLRPLRQHPSRKTRPRHRHRPRPLRIARRQRDEDILLLLI